MINNYYTDTIFFHISNLPRVVGFLPSEKSDIFL